MAATQQMWDDAEIQAMRDALAASASVQEAERRLSVAEGAIRKAFAKRRMGPPSGYLGTADATKARTEARAGWSPDHDLTHEVPAPFHLRGASTLYGKDGEVKLQWVKSQIDKESQLAALLDAVKGIAEPFRGASEPVPAPEHTNADLLTVYPMGDPHIGMYSWAEETGQSFDLEIAERNLVAAADHLVGLAPSSTEALVLNLGDFFHTDNDQNRTSRSNNPLDVDTRRSKVFRVGVRAIRRVIDQAKAKHERVHVWNVPGNHDDQSACVLSVCLSLLYENDPRVVVELSPAAFYYMPFGRCLLGATHGDNCKPSELPGIMAHDRAKDWGETRHRHWYTGHVHHESVKEYRGVTVETFRTLAPGDAWHARSGYRAGRDMKADIWHRQHGWINRHIVGIEMLPGAAA